MLAEWKEKVGGGTQGREERGGYRGTAKAYLEGDVEGTVGYVQVANY